MKLDGVTMETTEPTDAAAVVEPANPPDDNSTELSTAPPEEATGNGAPKTTPAANGKAAAAAGKHKPTTTKKQAPLSRTESVPGSRAAMTSRRPGADVKPMNNVASRNAPAKKPLIQKPPTQGTTAAPKKTQAVSTGSALTTKAQVKIPDKKPPGPASGATATSNGTRPASAALKKTMATSKPKPAGPVARPTGSTAPKAGTSTSTKPDPSASMKTARAATAPSMSRAAAKPPSAAAAKPPSATTATAKPPCTVRTTASRAATAPPSGRSTAAPPSKAAGPAKKDVSRPAAAVARKGPLASAKKAEVSKPAANMKPKVDPKLPPKPNTTKTSVVAAARLPAVTQLGPTPPGSPVSRASSATNTPRSKLASKPTQAVSPFIAGKRPERTGAAKGAKVASDKAGVAGAAKVPGVAAAAGAAVVQNTQAEPVKALPKESSSEATGTVEEAGVISAPCVVLETETEHATSSAPDKSRLRMTPQIELQQPPCDPSGSTLEPAPAAALVSAVPPPLQPEKASPVTETQTSHPPMPTLAPENEHPLIPTHNLNEDEEEEEKEGSQLVSISEMSGTTQLTEESRPGSAGPAGASAWRVGGALLSELDSEEVSVSPHGASELSAPGLLEGTESMDDLGEGSLKGAMDMEGASAGSPDFERVPEIPVNYDEDDEDEDMDVGSERADEPQRHDNDVDDDEDEDVEMASEGVTESGLESYGNADEDDFAEDERLDNLNRVVQPPPPPPLLPSAPAAQWDQPNPFSDPWADPVVLQPPPEAESPLTDPCQGDSETPTQESAQAWLELGSAANENQEDPHTLSGNKAQTPEQMCSAEPALSGVAPCAPCAPGSSPLRTMTSAASSPEEPKETAPLPSPQPEPALLPSAHAPGSNPSSSSVTEDEASDTEGEAQLDDSLETPVICKVNINMQPHGARCLSTVDEELEDSGAAEDATPPSATSQVSYGFDTTTSASNSNAQSTGESCVKSPGTFSLEELPEEAKEPPLTRLPPAPPSLSDQPYIQCGKDHEDSEQAVENKTPTPEKGFAQSECGAEEQMLPLDDLQPPYYSAICEKTENFAGFTALLHPQRRDHSSYPRSYCDIVKPVNATLASPKLSCTDLPPRSPKRQSLSPQLRRLEQHQRHLQELQQRREQQSRPIEEAEQERKRREEEEERKKKDEAEEEIKRNKEAQEKKREEDERKRHETEEEMKRNKEAQERKRREEEEERKKRNKVEQEMKRKEDKEEREKMIRREEEGKKTNKEEQERRQREEEEEAKKQEQQRKVLELQLHQQQVELKQRQQIIQWQQELQESSKGTPLLLSPSSGLCTIYEALERDDEDEEEAKREEEMVNELNLVTGERFEPPETQSTQQRPKSPTQNGDDDGDASSTSTSTPPQSPRKPSPLELEWGKKVDIVHQLINQTLLLNGDGCSSLLLLPGGAGGTLSPLESSLWPSMLPPLTPPSATVTSVSSFSPETSGASSQGEWTVVELETHH
ncbi:proline-rich protein 36 [Periophthalmus magnuspinnatus]|uniref:proline-rich protein 36 n=1 Tax=Periophthalmus magnuspinnatus TaxID=409849 RepID=UPI002436BFB2|nr:proline-rich protein 36 [Periophthalmus magnuspinnatus]